MRALDTNVLVRALVQDDAAQGRRAEAFLSAQPVYVPVTVILELEWVLALAVRVFAQSDFGSD